MNHPNLLITNVAVTYLRMVLTVGLSLYSTRLLYQALTDEDIGIINVLGSSVALIEVIRYSLSISTMRHLSHSLGAGDTQRFARTATTSLGLFALLAVVIYGVGQAATPLISFLNVPPERLDAAFWVFQFSLLSVARETLLAPINAVYVAKQALFSHALLSLPAPVLNLAAVALLFVFPGDRLVNYSWLFFVSQTVAAGATVAACFAMFPDSRPQRRFWDRSQLRELVGMASWSALADLGWQVRAKGSAILLNVFFGPVHNAAWEVTQRASNYQMSLTTGIRRAVLICGIVRDGVDDLEVVAHARDERAVAGELVRVEERVVDRRKPAKALAWQAGAREMDRSRPTGDHGRPRRQKPGQLAVDRDDRVPARIIHRKIDRERLTGNDAHGIRAEKGPRRHGAGRRGVKQSRPYEAETQGSGQGNLLDCGS